MKTIAIERRSGLSADQFARDYLAGEGRPVILTGAVEKWAARTKWSFAFFREAFGGEFVKVRASLAGKAARITKVSDFLDHLDCPDRVPGIWIHARKETPIDQPSEVSGAYLMDWHILQRHPELMADLAPPPGCIEDWSLRLDDRARASHEEIGREFWSVYIGPSGSLSELHQDYGTTHSYLVQIAGTKRATLFAPRDSGFLYEGDVDPENPDLGRFPLFDQATAYVADFGPGELLFTPGGWWHHVRGLTKSITVSHNFFNSANVAQYRAFIAESAPDVAAALD